MKTARALAISGRVLSIENLDRQMESLRRDMDPEEAKRLSRRLEAFGAARDDEPAERRQIRELLRGSWS